MYTWGPGLRKEIVMLLFGLKMLFLFKGFHNLFNKVPSSQGSLKEKSTLIKYY